MEKGPEVSELEDRQQFEPPTMDRSVSGDAKMSPSSTVKSFQSSFIDNFTFPILNRANTYSERPLPADDSPESKREKLTSFFVDWWLFEILCCCISTGCFIAIISILASWNNQALPSRWPMNINLTTLVAILAAIAKYSLVMPLDVCIGQLKWTWFQTGRSRQLLDLERYDQATRGPLGAARLVVYTKARYEAISRAEFW
jgi:hypothetical protein